MEEKPSNDSAQLPVWFVRLCKWLWEKHGLIGTTIILGIILNLFATWLFTPWSTDYKKLPIWVVFQNPITSLFIGILLLLLTFIIYLGSRPYEKIADRYEISNKSPSSSTNERTDALNNETKRRYLSRVIRDNETLTLKGIPAGLIDKGVQLDEVFIPLMFRPNRPLSEYPLTERELKKLRNYLEKGAIPEEMERVLIEAERSWLLHVNQNKRIKIAELWERLNSRYPAAVIQGYPGMGKTTLISRLALHMARCSLNQDDTTMPDQLEPPLIPIFLSLGRYATEIANAKKLDLTLSLMAYLELILQQMNVPGLINFIQESLVKGQCLILLDGLDEVSDLQIRNEIQEAIKAFIAEQSDTSLEVNDFNHFIITSRVAGYDQNAFPSYNHYTLAELTPKQIKDFLPRWCRASVHRDHSYTYNNQDDEEDIIAREAEQIEKKLNYAVMHNQGVRELVEIPLMLTLLAVMQQNSIELPRERVELYTVVTRTILENRNIAKNLPTIPEPLAIRRLGPIAFQMQETGNSFARLGDVLTTLKQIIKDEQGGTRDQITQEAEYFLNRIRERAGLFTQRAGDYFSFFHRSFQEYFAARHILNEIKSNPDLQISKLVEKARRSDDLWREPFLFAVAYKSRDDETVAQQIIQELLDISKIDEFNARAHGILLAGECVVEAKPSTLGSKIETQIVNLLLDLYEEAQNNQIFLICTQIEEVIQRWLMNLSDESYRSTLLIILSEAISGKYGLTQQYSSLTLIVMISAKLSFCSSIVFNMLIPSLLNLAGLPELEKNMTLTRLPKVQNFPAADLAITALSIMGSQGPGGIILRNIRKYFKNHPLHLQMLAKHSLELRTLLTPIIIPASLENYQKYEEAVTKWVSLRDQPYNDNDKNEVVNSCHRIHQTLLDIGEEVRFPGTINFLNILNSPGDILEQPVQKLWQTYLCAQLNDINYVFYQDRILLFLVLFPDMYSTNYIANIIVDHFLNHPDSQPCSQKFIATLSEVELIDWDMDFQLSIYDSGGPPNPRSIRFRNSLWFSYNLMQYQDLFYTREAIVEKGFRGDGNFVIHNSSWTAVRYLQSRSHIHLSSHGELIRINRLLKLLLNKQVILKTIDLLSSSLLSSSEDVEVQKELANILLGYIVILQKSYESDNIIKQEIENIISFIHRHIILSKSKAVTDIMIDSLSHLPARSVDEIQYLLQSIEKTSENKLQEAYAASLKHSRPKNPEAWAILEVATESKIAVVAATAKERLQLKIESESRRETVLKEGIRRSQMIVESELEIEGEPLDDIDYEDDDIDDEDDDIYME